MQLAEQKNVLARKMLASCALADFNHAAEVCGNKSLANYTRCIIVVTIRGFPQKALQDQKRWMRHFLNKPRDILVQDYIACMIEINDCLEAFPPVTAGRNSTKLPDLLEFRIPIKRQRQIQFQNFNNQVPKLYKTSKTYVNVWSPN